MLLCRGRSAADWFGCSLGIPGVPAGLTQTYYKAFAPRIGLAYSPNFNSGLLGKMFGSNGKTSIRTGWGLFYNPMEQLVLEQFGAEPPFGGSSYFPGTFFNTPFVQQNGTVNPKSLQRNSRAEVRRGFEQAAGLAELPPDSALR